VWSGFSLSFELESEDEAPITKSPAEINTIFMVSFSETSKMVDESGVGVKGGILVSGSGKSSKFTKSQHESAPFIAVSCWLYGARKL
jgi:hypothetical protein